MNRESFERRHAEQWARLAALLDDLDARRADSRRAAELPALHRRCCHHLALARARHLGADLEERLNALALRGHQRLYREQGTDAGRIADFLLRGFPRLVRKEARLFWLATLLFYGPMLAMGALTWHEPEAIYSLLDAGTVRRFEEMYAGAPGGDGERGADADFMMFGHYVQNNVSIAFRTFAGGLLAGAGTVFILTTNGLIIGGIGAHLTATGRGEAFWSFVVTHGAFELTAIVIAGVAGLRLGLALIAPGRLRRSQALREAGRRALPLVLGVAALLLVAAFVEAFWSSARWAGPALKAWVGATAWLAVAVYLGTFGRERAA